MIIKYFGMFTALVDLERRQVHIRERQYHDPLPQSQRAEIRRWMLQDIDDYLQDGFVLIDETRQVEEVS